MENLNDLKKDIVESDPSVLLNENNITKNESNVEEAVNKLGPMSKNFNIICYIRTIFIMTFNLNGLKCFKILITKDLKWKMLVPKLQINLLETGLEA